MAVATHYATEELMAAVCARTLRNREVCFVGLGTGGRAFVLAVAIPILACRLAQRTHAPDLIAMLGPIIDADLEAVPDCVTDYNLITWPCSAEIYGPDSLDMFKRGKIDVGFVSGAQVDQYGNLNIVSIGDYAHPRVRLVGPLAQPEHMAQAGRTIITAEHTPRTFVERVDFISGVGFLEGGESRTLAGLRGGGPALVVSDLAVMDFEERSKRMRLVSVHPGVSVDRVRAQTGFDLVVPGPVPETPPPPAEELTILRAIDPRGRLLGAAIT